MTKRISRENARDRKASEDMSDGGPPKKKKRYNLRKRGPSSDKDAPPSDDPVIEDDKKKKPPKKKEEVLWINDDTLMDDSDSDSSYEDEEGQPIAINIHFHNTISAEEDESEDENAWGGEEKPSNDGFLMYLMEKYANGVEEESEDEDPKSKKKGKEKLPIKLNAAEKKYYYGLKGKKQKEFLQTMERISKLGFEEGEVPYKFKVLELPISDYMKSNVIKKVNALSEMSGDTGEAHKMRNWIDGFLRIPFGKTTPLPVRITDGKEKCTKFMVNAKSTMDDAIYGMGSAKLQIMQIIAQWIVNPESVGNVIALRGPMGVGKTSFAKNAIAKVLNRPFEFFSLGGASDISNFVGHSYTYEGSMWGRIADSLMHAGTMNPVFYFDEVDKISSTPHGEEITSMLIHLTDRSQNTQFHDRYFSGVEFDVSQCLFVFSLNDLDKVHPILRDRMTIINCEGYNEKDKKEILKDYVLPQLYSRLKFTEDELVFTDDAMKFIISEFSADEKGVRTLIRTVESMMTRLNMLRVASDETMKEYSFYMDVSFPLTVDEKVVKTLLCDATKKEPESWRTMYM